MHSGELYKMSTYKEQRKERKRKLKKAEEMKKTVGNEDVADVPEKIFLNKYSLPDPVCLYKWTWSTIRLGQGTTNSCHRTKSDDLTPENYKDFHNTPTKLKHRTLMQKGKWPGEGCEYCRDIEAAGGLSDRLELMNDIEFAPKELRKNPRSINLTPAMVEVYFNNLCNLNCIYCSAEYSTVWEAEEKKFNLANPKNLEHWAEKKKQYPAMLAKHWEWMEGHAHNIKQYRILGGEPFFQPEFEQNLDFFERHPCPDTKLIVFSNLKVANKKLRSYLDRITELEKKHHIRKFQLVCSFDCWGPQIEYIRTGTNLKQWEENFLTVLHDYPHVVIEVHGTLISLTMDTLPDLCKKVAEWNLVRPIKHSVSFANGRPHMDVGIFPYRFFDQQFREAINNHNIPTTIRWLDGFWKKVNAQKYEPHRIKELKESLDEFDRRRGTNWKELWPWLDKYEV